MRFDSIFSRDDAKFMDATLDEGKRQERIERLSRSRRLYYIVVSIQCVILVLTTLTDVMSRSSHVTNTGTSPPTIFWSMFVLFFAIYLYTDLQIKFLKAGTVRGSNVGG